MPSINPSDSGDSDKFKYIFTLFVEFKVHDAFWMFLLFSAGIVGELRNGFWLFVAGEKSYQMRLNQTHPMVNALKNVNELSALLIRDNGFTDLAARAKV